MTERIIMTPRAENYENLRVDDDHFFCECGNPYFCVVPDGVYCPQCGLNVEVHS